jgi:hypothetical protein
VNALPISGLLTRRARVLLWDELQPVGLVTKHDVVCVHKPGTAATSPRAVKLLRAYGARRTTRKA